MLAQGPTRPKSRVLVSLGSPWRPLGIIHFQTDLIVGRVQCLAAVGLSGLSSWLSAPGCCLHSFTHSASVFWPVMSFKPFSQFRSLRTFSSAASQRKRSSFKGSCDQIRPTQVISLCHKHKMTRDVTLG